MIEIQRLIDSLRNYLQREFLDRSDELMEMISQYAAACQASNARLRDCDDLLKRGLPTEAVFLAKAEPDLLDTVTLLDFPEKSDLLEICELYSITQPEPLLMEVAEVLQEAYTQRETLQPLLAQHQQLVLGRRPLRERIPLLREIRDVDPDSPFWIDDLREMESQRLREIADEARQATAQGDVASLQSLLAEAQSNQWVSAVPAALIQDLKKRGRATVTQDGKARMAELAEELHAAYMTQDAAQARLLREEWQAKQRIVKAPANDPLVEQVSPILQWLEDLDRVETEERNFQRAVLRVEQLVEDDQATMEELQKAGAELMRFERSLPTGLDLLFNQRMERLELGQTRKRQTIYGAVGFATLAAAAVFGVVIYFSIQADQARKVAQAVQQHVEAGQLAQARELLEGKPEFLSSTEWLEARQKLIDAEIAEQNRVTAWNQALSEVKTQLEAAEADMTLAKLAAIEAPLNTAKDLSRTETEKTAVLVAEGDWERKRGMTRQKLEAAFREQLSSAAAEVQVVDQTRNLNTEAGRELMTRAEQKVMELQAEQEGVSRELTSQVELLQARLINARARAIEMETEERLLTAVTKGAFLSPTASLTEADGLRFSEALKDFAKNLPEHPRAAVFTAAAEASPLPATVGRRQLSLRWRSKLIPVSFEEATERVNELTAYLEKYPNTPDRVLLERYLKWLNSIQLRQAEDGDEDEGLARQAIRLFSSKLMSETYTLTSHGGTKTYYLEEAHDGKKFGNPPGFSYLVGFNGEVKKASLSTNDFSQVPSAPAPHETFCKDSRRLFQSVNLTNWDRLFKERSLQLLAEPKIDPFLRYLLLYKLVEFAGRGDLLLEEELRPVKRHLDEAGIDRTVAWMDPENGRANKARELSADCLKKLPPLEECFEKYLERRAEFEAELFMEPFPVGWLERVGNNQWGCRSIWAVDQDHDLLVIATGTGPGSSRWQKVGSAARKTLTIDSVVAAPHGEPAIVYAMPRKKSVAVTNSP